MTGGVVVVLGETGRNFGAGMSGGRAFVWDPHNRLPDRYNPGMVALERLTNPEEEKRLEALIYAHLEATDSPRAGALLKEWRREREQFWVVVPHPAEARPASQPVHEPEKVVVESKPSESPAAGTDAKY
jgi:glutamate synthase (NADPH/NADH) large chain/glutamate synthase (ferredoxin)